MMELLPDTVTEARLFSAQAEIIPYRISTEEARALIETHLSPPT